MMYRGRVGIARRLHTTRCEEWQESFIARGRAVYAVKKEDRGNSIVR